MTGRWHTASCAIFVSCHIFLGYSIPPAHVWMRINMPYLYEELRRMMKLAASVGINLVRLSINTARCFYPVSHHRPFELIKPTYG